MDWTKGVEAQRFRYMLVDPDTWQDTAELDGITSCEVTWDESADTLISASVSSDGDMPDGERIVRVYHEAEQGGERSRDCLCTLVAQTPRWSVDGSTESYTMACYGSLLDLKDDQPPIGFSVASGTDPLQAAATVAKAHMRAPVIAPTTGRAMEEPWVAEDDDSWLDVVSCLASLGGCRIMVDSFGRLRFEPVKRTSAMAATRTFDDSNSSVMLPDVSVETDMYGVPNVVEVVWSESGRSVSATAVNRDETMGTSLPRRGRTVLNRIVNPDEIGAGTTKAGAQAVADARLSELAHREQQVSFAHAILFPLPELGDCVRLVYEKFGIDCRAVVRKQTIACDVGATVSTTATWRG